MTPLYMMACTSTFTDTAAADGAITWPEAFAIVGVNLFMSAACAVAAWAFFR